MIQTQKSALKQRYIFSVSSVICAFFIAVLLSSAAITLPVHADRPAHTSETHTNVPPPPDSLLRGKVSEVETLKRLPRKEASKDETAMLFRQRGIIALAKNDLDGAEENLEKALELKPTDTELMDQLANVCLQKHDEQGACTFLWLANRINHALNLSLDPRNQERPAQIKQLEDSLKARIAANGGGRFTTKDWWPHDLEKSLNCRAIHMFGMGDTKNAMRLFQEVLRLNANNVDALFNIGAVCEQERNFPSAKQYYTAALDRGMLDAGAKDALLSIGERVAQFRGGIDKTNINSGTKTHFTCPLCRILRGQTMDSN